MKKIVLVAVAALVSLSAFAQQGKFAAGVFGSYVTADPGLIGVGAKVQYSVLDQIRPEASFTYFLKKDNVKSWSADVNVHYIFNLGSVNVYPFAGINYTYVKVDIPGVPNDLQDQLDGLDIAVPAIPSSASDKKIGANLGCGIEYPISETIAIAAEAKYTLNKLYNDGSLVVGAGVVFKF